MKNNYSSGLPDRIPSEVIKKSLFEDLLVGLKSTGKDDEECERIIAALDKAVVISDAVRIG